MRQMFKMLGSGSIEIKENDKRSLATADGLVRRGLAEFYMSKDLKGKPEMRLRRSLDVGRLLT
jgi:hypothetical protein